MSLADWQKNGWLTGHRTSAREIADLFAVVERDLADSATEQLSADAPPPRCRDSAKPVKYASQSKSW